MGIFINSSFDSGNISLISQNDNEVRLEIKKDNDSEFYQWFYFQVSNVLDLQLNYVIKNASDAAYAQGFHGYNAVASYDNESWFRVESHYDDKELSFSFKSEQETIYFAYFAPYDYARHQSLISFSLGDGRLTLETLGQTIDGRPIELVRSKTLSKAKRNLWIIARQHPGESMAEWFMEGFIESLTDESRTMSKKLFDMCNIYMIPNMNPDGSVRGHLRTNAVGSNLNREWLSPSIERSPEVYHVLAKMRDYGMDFCLDIHGDESIPHNFLAGGHNVENWNKELEDEFDLFESILMEQSPDFQNTEGYGIQDSDKIDMSIGSYFLTNEFNCNAITLEMPFKDTANYPHKLTGWSPERSKVLGEDVLRSIFILFNKK